MRYPNLPLFFGRVLGKDNFSIESQAIAMYQPRDIVLVLDFSGSMNDDSELKSIPDPRLRRDAWKTWNRSTLSSVRRSTATCTFDPQYITSKASTAS